MADTDNTENTVTVDGVEPSILVKLVDSKENPGRVKVSNDDSGAERFLVKGEDGILLTPQDLALVGGVEVEIVDDSPAPTSAPEPSVAPAGPKPAEVVFSPSNSPGLPGQ